MAEGDEPVVPQGKAEGQEASCSLGDLECRSRNLGLALMRKGVLRDSANGGGVPQKRVARAVKLSSEFLASIIVGAVLGLGLDKLAGSLPWGLVFFLFLGFAAGILNILRSVGSVAPSQVGRRGTLHQNKEADRPGK
ncbi:ATP synthase protein I [Bartonella australis AUST/NH1]|uniref:ATP synthase protein I n=1 Tax=Bartonella australis (strain Aust/NH1) TaxID=1094489 RepID=M1PC72_BARAA|nr:AtpZ/AtpI family protein [Bartonella australis]AGF74221.1 ATP synthase protein I [Bartonella australis AUST/NH1]